MLAVTLIQVPLVTIAIRLEMAEKCRVESNDSIKLTLMKYLLPTILMLLCWPNLMGQNLYENTEGKVSYVTTQNVYVKFQSTVNIVSGDTLFTNKDDILAPIVVVKDISSISCVCIPISDQKLSVGDLVFSRQKVVKTENPGDKNKVSGLPASVPGQDSVIAKKDQSKKRAQIVTGNISAASYLNFSNVTSNSQRMKYTFSMVIQNIGNSKLSAETYISFAHKLGEWGIVQNDIFNGLKIYSLALNYEINKHNTDQLRAS